MADKSITVDVPQERVAEFYLWFSHFLDAPAGTGPPRGPRGGFGRRPGGLGPDDAERAPWSTDDMEAARRLYHRLSPPAREMFDILIDAPGEPVTGNDLAARLGLENGAHSVAGILAWPGRWSRKLGRVFPITTEGREDGATDYLMDAQTAAVFAKARPAS